MDNLSVGFAICGSYCTYDKMLLALREAKEKYGKVRAIMSEKSFETSTRFGTAEHFVSEIENITGENIISTIKDAEPAGPKRLFDVLVIAPCTGNTLAKIANGIADTAVTLVCKAHLRNNRPVVMAISTNDGLSGNAANIGTLLNRKNFYFVPYYQDDPVNKPFSLVADLSKLPDTVDAAMRGVQLQPILLAK